MVTLKWRENKLFFLMMTFLFIHLQVFIFHEWPSSIQIGQKKVPHEDKTSGDVLKKKVIIAKKGLWRMWPSIHRWKQLGH